MVMDGYAGGFSTLYLTDATALSGNGLAAAIANHAILPLGRGKLVYVECGHSVAAATVGVSVILHSKSDGTGAIGVAPPGEQVSTAGVMRDTTNTGNYHGAIMVFVGCDAPYYEVRVTTAPSSGNADVKTWSY